MRPLAPYLRDFIMRLALGLASLALVACSAEAAVREDTIPVGDTELLVVRTDNGSISVQGADTSEVQVTARVRNPGRVDYRAVRHGNTVEVIAEVKGGPGPFESGGADIQVVAPRDIDVTLESSNGPVTLEGVAGQVKVKTSNGDISLSQVRGAINLETSSGRASVADATGILRLKTSNGPVDIKGFTGQMDAETSNGAIDFAGTLSENSENRLSTSNGDINVELTSTPGVRLDAATSNGRVSSHLPVNPDGEVEEGRLVGTIGNGGARLVIRVSNGSITMR